MELLFRLAALCLIAALLSVLLRKGSAEQGFLLLLAACLGLLLLLCDPIRELYHLAQELAEAAGLQEELFAPLFKVLAISVVVRIGGSLCKDAGASALAAALEIAGAICGLLAALPLLRSAFHFLLELMGT